MCLPHHHFGDVGGGGDDTLVLGQNSMTEVNSSIEVLPTNQSIAPDMFDVPTSLLGIIDRHTLTLKFEIMKGRIMIISLVL